MPFGTFVQGSQVLHTPTFPKTFNHGKILLMSNSSLVLSGKVGRDVVCVALSSVLTSDQSTPRTCFDSLRLRSARFDSLEAWMDELLKRRNPQDCLPCDMVPSAPRKVIQYLSCSFKDVFVPVPWWLNFS